MTQHIYQVTGMTCGHCELSVREALSEIPGIHDIQISAETGELVVTASGAITDQQVVSAIDEAGYQAVPV